MAADPFFQGGPSFLETGIGAAMVAVIGVLWRKMGRREERNEELHQAISELNNLRIEDQKQHTREIIEAAERTHETSAAIHAAIDALKQKQKPPGNA